MFGVSLPETAQVEPTTEVTRRRHPCEESSGHSHRQSGDGLGVWT